MVGIVLVVVPQVGRMAMAVVHIVDMVVVGDRLVPAPGSVLVAVLLSLQVRRPTSPPDERGAHRGREIAPDGEQHDGAA